MEPSQVDQGAIRDVAAQYLKSKENDGYPPPVRFTRKAKNGEQVKLGQLVRQWKDENKIPDDIDRDIIRNFELMRWIGPNAMKRPAGVNKVIGPDSIRDVATQYVNSKENDGYPLP